MCFDSLFGSDKKTDAQKELEAERAAMDAKVKREAAMRDSELSQARRSAIKASEDDAAAYLKPETPDTKKKKYSGLSGLRISKAGLNTGSSVGTGLVIGG